MTPKLTRTQLVQRISEVCDLSRRDAKVALEIIFDSLAGALQRGDTVYIRRFGTFFSRLRPPRLSRNPLTGAQVNTPAKKIVRFKPSEQLLRLVAAGQITIIERSERGK